MILWDFLRYRLSKTGVIPSQCSTSRAKTRYFTAVVPETRLRAQWRWNPSGFQIHTTPVINKQQIRTLHQLVKSSDLLLLVRLFL